MTKQIDLRDWDNRYLTDKEVAAIYGVARATVWRWVGDGTLPAPIKIGGNTTRWHGEAIKAAMTKQEDKAA